MSEITTVLGARGRFPALPLLGGCRGCKASGCCVQESRSQVRCVKFLELDRVIPLTCRPGGSILACGKRLPLVVQQLNSVSGEIRDVAKKRYRQDLGRRERQIMDVIFEMGEASVSDVLARIPDPPSYSAVRTMIRYLEAKGLLRHRREGTRYIYRPSEAKESVRRSALSHLIKTFFGGSAPDAVAAILDVCSERLSDGELDRVERLISEARKEGR